MGQSTDAVVGWGIAYASEGGCDYDAIDATENRLKAEGVDARLVTHCSGECPMLAIVIPSTYRVAYRGSPKKCDSLFAMGRQEAWDASIRRAAEIYLEELKKTGAGEFIDDYREELAIKPDQLGWYLFSDWT